MRWRRPCTAAWLAAVLPGGGLAASDLVVRAEVHPSLIGVKEAATFTIEVTGAGLGGKRFSPSFELENLEVVGGPNRAHSLRFVNGVTSQSESLSWYMRPLEVGRARVHSIRVEAGGESRELPDALLEVREAPVAAPPPRRRDPFGRFFEPLLPRRRGRDPREATFLRAEVGNRTPFVGEQVFYSLYLFSQADVSGVHPEALPEFQGLWVNEIPRPERVTPEMVEIDGKTYGRVPLLRRALFPLRDGTIEIEPASVRLGVRVPDPGGFGSFFGRTQEFRRESNGLRLEVRPLPPPPEGFSGAVGRLRLAAELDPDELGLGEAARLSITLSGEGHLQGLQAPELPALEEVRVFPPEIDGEQRVLGERVHGRRTWTYVLIPERTGSWSIPEMTFPYFDPVDASYARASAPGLTLSVEGPAPVPGSGPADAESAGSAETPTPPPAKAEDGLGPLLLLSSVAAGVVVALLLLRRRDRTPGATGARHQLDASLRRSEELASTREAAAELEGGWRNYLGERWDLEPGTPNRDWGKSVAEHGVDPALARELDEVVEDLHYLRYAPQLSDAAGLQREVVQRSRRLLRALR